MLLRYLLTRGSTSSTDDGAFRVRGEAVSRLEGFSDTVFGFAITLLVISLKPPETATEVLNLLHSVLPFIASFFVLFGLWRAQFDFFRRYGLEDRRTVTLTGVLLMFVLLFIYPLRFLSGFILDVLPRALLAGNDSMKSAASLYVLPKVLMLNAISIAGVMAVLALLYRYAATKSESLELSELELFDTRVSARRYAGIAVTNGATALWCVVLLSLPTDNIQDRDSAWHAGYIWGWLVVLVVAMTQSAALRRMKRARASISPAVPSLP
jgi:Endosomal/lysosomal potassium channel TMEM175